MSANSNQFTTTGFSYDASGNVTGITNNVDTTRSQSASLTTT